ncbi:MAG: glutathione S-transferase family protein [Pseudomonadota bacterium]
MILYGRDLSPFTRRIAIQCRLQDRDVERCDILTAGPEFEELRQINPLGRVPVLVLDDGQIMMESFAIGDWLDETSPNGVRLLPLGGEDRRKVLQLLAMASGTADKAVALVYDKNRRPEEFHWPDWHARLETQIQGGLGLLEGAVRDTWPTQPNAAEIAAVIAYQFIQATNPHLLDPGYPRLASLVDQAMQMPAMAETLPTV